MHEWTEGTTREAWQKLAISLTRITYTTWKVQAISRGSFLAAWGNDDVSLLLRNEKKTKRRKS